MRSTECVEGTSWGDKIFIGLPVVFVGILMNYGLFRFMPDPTASVEALFTFLFLSAYGVVANLFVLVGLKKILGPHPTLDHIIRQDLKTLVWILLGASVVTIAAAVIAAMAT